MAQWEGKSRGGVTGYRIFIWFLKNPGLRAAYALLALVAVYFIPFAPRATASAWYYFRRIQKWSFPKSIIALYINYFRFGQSLLDRIAMLAGIKTHLSFFFDGEEHLHRLAAEKQAALLISAHIGNWEIAGNMFKHIGGKVNIVMYEAEHENLKRLLDTVQTEKNQVQNVHVIPLRDDLSHVLALSNAVNAGELIALHGDRVPPGSKYFEFDFMGQKARFPSGPFYLAARFRIPVCFVFACREPKGHYHLFCTPPKLYEIKGKPQEREDALKVLIQDYVKTVEEKVKRYPYQWYNFYRFWN